MRAWENVWLSMKWWFSVCVCRRLGPNSLFALIGLRLSCWKIHVQSFIIRWSVCAPSDVFIKHTKNRVNGYARFCRVLCATSRCHLAGRLSVCLTQTDKRTDRHAHAHTHTHEHTHTHTDARARVYLQKLYKNAVIRAVGVFLASLKNVE